MNNFMKIGRGLRWVLLCLIALLNFNTLYANNDELTHHVIIAIDYSPAPHSGGQWMMRDAVFEAVDRITRMVVKDGAGHNRKILSANDCYSLVAFRANVNYNNLVHYVRPLSFNGNSMLFVRSEGENSLNNRLSNQNVWGQWLSQNPWEHSGGSAYSLLTVAKPYCLNYFAGCEVKKDVNRTFLIIISDRIFNGDMYEEIRNLGDHNVENGTSRIRGDEVYEVLYQVNQSYFTKHLHTEELKYRDYHPYGFVDLYEFVPLQKNFRLSSVLELPTRIEAKRIRGNKYAYNINFSSRNNPSYKPISLKVYSDSSDLLNSYNEEELSSAVELYGEIDNEQRYDKLNFVAEVRLMDGVYNNTVLSPSERALKEAGREGLNHSIEINYEKRAKIFFIPMFDCMWFSFLPDDQESAALIWELIIGFIIVLLAMIYVVMLYYKNRYYTPTIDDIELKVNSK
ncbi:MAG: hypothetical protein J6K74_04270 [Marinifilaceae bacterium]|nr:hypothetical protein [Marinifilaceae bacterium]